VTRLYAAAAVPGQRVQPLNTITTLCAASLLSLCFQKGLDANASKSNCGGAVCYTNTRAYMCVLMELRCYLTSFTVTVTTNSRWHAIAR
jgi:hypothetical protein